jgi:hypothetical protein
MWNDIGDVSSQATLLALGAGLALAEGRPAAATRSLGALQALRDRGVRFFTPWQVLPIADPEMGARSALTEAEFEAAWREGRQRPPDQALALVTARPTSEEEE